MGYSQNDIEYEKAVADEKRRDEYEFLKKALISACDSEHPRHWVNIDTKTRKWLSDWYKQMSERRYKELEEREKIKRSTKLRKSGLSKLSRAEKEALGL
jgi:hypothetical protein